MDRKPLSTQKFNNRQLGILELGLDREDLKDRILQRTINMFSTELLMKLNTLFLNMDLICQY